MMRTSYAADDITGPAQGLENDVDYIDMDFEMANVDMTGVEPVENHEVDDESVNDVKRGLESRSRDIKLC
jgi:hypothetical protein